MAFIALEDLDEYAPPAGLPVRELEALGVAGVDFVGDDPPTFTALAATRQAVESLNADIRHQLEELSPVAPSYGGLTELFIEYDAFTQEFEGWYAVASQPSITGSEDARRSLPNYQERYLSFRARAVALGLNPSQNLTTDSRTGGVDWVSVLKWGAVIAGVIVVAPFLIGPIAGPVAGAVASRALR